MKSNWITTMDLITMCMGGAIIVLGTSFLCGGATLPPVLVTGISLAGFCLTLSDYVLKMDVKNQKIINTESKRRLFVLIMHSIAVYGIIVFPNLVIFDKIDKERLEFIGTVMSVIALGFVILTIGLSNRKEVINDITEQFQFLKSNQEAIDKLKKRVPELEKELKESREQALRNKEEAEKLTVRLIEAEEKLKNQSD
ncbi:hypothetical protein EXW51_00035 (plasmid) [Bacillus mycoides]|uniref:hypothetical protein n=1 Tax=Bacillus mycoides TaxID=1405 RepID=UPI001C028B32|nr:hypothetical protein [Bacillus mycoides]QWH26511.1 hypothetical protein EXW51_00035 [Bacillus mycoides]